MTIAFACDHGGFPFRESIINHLKKLWHTVVDLWPQSLEELDDFPDYSEKVCQEILHKRAERGVLVCGTGIGMSIAANRHIWIFAALAYSPEIAKISRSHNDSNMICFGARTMKIDDVLESLDIFLAESFMGGKYQSRNDKLNTLCE